MGQRLRIWWVRWLGLVVRVVTPLVALRRNEVLNFNSAAKDLSGATESYDKAQEEILRTLKLTK